MTNAQIEAMLPWGPGKLVQTKRGERLLRKAAPTEVFWNNWQHRRGELTAAGVSVSQEPKSREWMACWWGSPPVEVVQARERAVAASKATDATIDIPAPEGLSYLPYQRAGISRALEILQGGKGAFIGDEMGLGKTIQAVGLINTNKLIHQVLIICPAKLKLNWYRELKRWLVRGQSIGIAEPDVFPSTDIVIINFDILHKFPKSLVKMWDAVIVDEVHFLKNPKARRTQCVFGYKPTKKELAAGATGKTPIVCKRRIAMSGTPIVNRPNELFPIINWLDPENFGNFFAYAKRFCAAQNNGFGWDFSGASNLSELQTKLRASVLIRRLKKDVLKELPAKRRIVVELPSEGISAVVKEASAMREREEQIVALKAAVEIAKAEVESEYKAAVEKLQDGLSASFAEMSALRHETALAKLPLVVETLKEDLEEVEKLLVFAHHRDVLESLRDAFPGESVLVYGGMTTEQTMRCVDAFQTKDKTRVFVGSITAAGVGLNLTRASLVDFAELDWVPGNMTQCEDRAHRIGQQDSVLVKHLVLSGSIDAELAKTLVTKQEVIDKALDLERDQLAAEPIVPIRAASEAISTTREQVAREAVKLTPKQVAAILIGLKALSGMCDGARKLDGSGFNKIDAAIGKSLAERLFITPKQAVIGLRLVVKYQRQLPGELVNEAKGMA